MRKLTALPAVEQRAALLAGKQITYTLKRSGKRRSIGLRIDDRGLTVSVPLRASEKWLSSVLQEKAHWVVEKLDGWQMSRQPEQRWQDGERIDFLGELLELRVMESLFAAPAQPPQGGRRGVPNGGTVTLAQRRGDELWVFVAGDRDGAHIEQAVAHWYRSEAEQLFARRVAHYAPLLNAVPRTVHLSQAQTQWGSCTAQGAVRLNVQLIKLPQRLIDYVVVHELAHLRELNHSPDFWRVVESVCPDYASLRSELRAVAIR
ncbi:MAG: SprT family zinc-dependent metalloprotease [Gallionella sp.]